MDDDEYDEELMSTEGDGNNEKNQEHDPWRRRRRRRRRRVVVVTLRRRHLRRRGTIQFHLPPSMQRRLTNILLKHGMKINKGITGLRRAIFLCCNTGRKQCSRKWFCFLGKW